MKEIKIITKTTLFETFIYEISFDDNIYKGVFSPTSFIESFIVDKKPSLYKISVSKESKEVFSIYKNYKTPLSENLYTISCYQTNYSVKDLRNFKIPDFFIPTDFGNLEVSGTVATGEYSVKISDNTVATITTVKNKDLKEYTISHNLDFNHCNELLISIVLIIDSLYHYY